MRILIQDIRYALRQLRKAPGFTFVCIQTLALGIGANTAIFTLVDAVMLKSLPVRNPKQLYRVGNSFNCCVLDTNREGNWSLFNYQFYKLMRDHTPEFEEMTAFQSYSASQSVRRERDTGPPKPLPGEFVSGNYFQTFGVSAFAGRTLLPSDDQPGTAPVIVLSYRLWQQSYALDPSIVGSTLFVGQVPYTVVGIAAPGFFGETLRSDPPDLWMPLSTAAGSRDSVNSVAGTRVRIGCTLLAA